MKNTYIRRQEINYFYKDANIIPRINKYLMDCDLDMKLIKLSWDVMNGKVKIIFKSDFEVRKIISCRLREFDNQKVYIINRKWSF